MTITLWGGPFDGREIGIDDALWRSRRIRVPIIRGPYWTEDVLSTARIEAAMYECRRWVPAWAGPCAMPIFRWTYAGTY